MIDIQNKDEKIFYLSIFEKLNQPFKSFEEKAKYAKMPPEIQTINQKLFENFTNIETISLHENVTTLLSVNKCLPNLKEIIIFPSKNSDTCQIFQSISKMKNVDAYIQFPNGPKVKVNFIKNKQSIELPSEIIIIPEFFFHECVNLESIMFSSNLIEIGQSAFYKCFGLCEINFPENLVKICDSAFNGCKSLEKVGFNKNLEFIGANAFSGCVKLFKADLSKCIRIKVNVKDFPENCKVILPHKK